MTCWQCGGKLNEGPNGPIFALFTDPVGNQHKVHKSCGANLHGRPRITAQEREQCERMDEYHERQEEIRRRYAGEEKA